MMKVLLVDDEPVILQGLSVLIDWKAEGYEIVRMCANGQEALTYLETHPVDLIIADIKMPIMSGLELLKTIREEQISDAYFIILSGYNDFHYAQSAIRYSCLDYILKPVQKSGLLECLRSAASDRARSKQHAEDARKMRQAYLSQSLIALIRGKYTENQAQFVQENMDLTGGLRYVHIHMGNIAMLEEMSDGEVAALRERLAENCERFLREGRKEYCIRDTTDCEEENEVGFLCCDSMFQSKKETLEEFMEEMLGEISKNMEMPVFLLVGKRVETISRISTSYTSACTLRNFVRFGTLQKIYYYEDEIQIPESDSFFLCKDNLDRLLQAIEQNDRPAIYRSVDDFYDEMSKAAFSEKMVAMNMNYLLFQLIHLATRRDETVRQDEIMLYMNEHISQTELSNGSRAYLRKFACEYADYLVQLRQNVSCGVLAMVEKEISEHYAENLTLRELGQKYYVNSSYLGQIFRKQYGKSFKDYLSNYRICKAAELLLKTDKKISQIAEEVGYLDTDYFVNKFIERKGCTPSKYRKNRG
ncbi:MAG: response regulator [Lachnospiraceae bacterium]|nr:response regulator [Lachnospiraceae bacterium]